MQRQQLLYLSIVENVFASNTLNSACISGTDRELLVQPEWRLHGHCMFSAADWQSGEDKSCIVRIVSQFD